MINFQQYKVTAGYSNLEFWSDFNKAGLFFGCPDRVNGAGSISKDRELVQQKTGQERLALLCWTFMAAELSLEDQPNSFQHQEKRGVPGQGQEGWRSLCPARKLICIQNNWTLYLFFFKFRFNTALYSLLIPWAATAGWVSSCQQGQGPAVQRSRRCQFPSASEALAELQSEGPSCTAMTQLHSSDAY